MILVIMLFLASQTLPQVFLFYELLHAEVVTSAQLQLSNGGEGSHESKLLHHSTSKPQLQWENLSVCCFPLRSRASLGPSSCHTRIKAAEGIHTSNRAGSVNI